MKLEILQRVALAVTRSRSLEETLRGLVDGLDENLDLALVRLWLVRPGDQCEACPLAAECETRVPCLHLVASQGTPAKKRARRPTRVDGAYRRFPIGVRKVGAIASRREPLEIRDVRRCGSWIKEPDWALGEGVESFAGYPLVYQGELLGVLALFSRQPLRKAQLGWLRTFAEHATIAIENARSREEVLRLKERLEEERDYLREEVRESRPFGDILGESLAIQRVKNQIGMAAPTDSTILVLGESGTGKELAARAVHEHSGRRDGPLVRVNCASIPAELFESEFFGHVKGAFSGAVQDRTGRFQLADGGTLFLDEVGEIPLGLQGKLLRVLQEGEFEKVGGDRTTRVDVRVVAATNRDLRAAAEAGEFRLDLYYRLGVFPIELPPLRNRVADIPALAEHFLQLSAGRLGRRPPRLRPEQVDMLQAYPWPGNIRELQNVLERAAILSPPGEFCLLQALPGRDAPPLAPRDAGGASGLPSEVLTEVEVEAFARANLEAALARCRGKVSGPGGAAELLGVHPSTLASRIRALGIERPRRR